MNGVVVMQQCYGTACCCVVSWLAIRLAVNTPECYCRKLLRFGAGKMQSERGKLT